MGENGPAASTTAEQAEQEMKTQAAALRQRTEETIAMLERFQKLAQQYYAKSEDLAAKLTNESKKREEGEKAIAENKKNIETLRKEKDGLAAELKSITQQLANVNTAYESLQSDCTTQEQKLSDLSLQSQRLTGEIQSQELLIAQKSGENAQLSAEMENLRSVIVAKDETNSKLAEEILALRSLLAERDSEMDGIRDALVAEQNSQDDREQSLRDAVREKDEKLLEMTQQINEQEELLVGIKFLRPNIESFQVGAGDLKEPCAACMLPDGSVVVADTLRGLLKYSSNTELKAHVESESWKWPQGLAYDNRRKLLVVSMAKRVGKLEKFERAIAEFDLDLNLLDTMSGPETGMDFDNISKEKLCIGKAGEIYLSLADNLGSSLWKYMGVSWFQLTSRPSAHFSDVQVLADSGVISEVIVTETKMGYLHKFGVRGADIVDRRSVAAVEKPGAICVDEAGRFFCQDVISGKIRLIDNVRFEVKMDICVVDEPVFSITAANGYLGVAVRDSKTVKVFKYSHKVQKPY